MGRHELSASRSESRELTEEPTMHTRVYDNSQPNASLVLRFDKPGETLALGFGGNVLSAAPPTRQYEGPSAVITLGEGDEAKKVGIDKGLMYDFQTQRLERVDEVDAMLPLEPMTLGEPWSRLGGDYAGMPVSAVESAYKIVNMHSASPEDYNQEYPMIQEVSHEPDPHAEMHDALLIRLAQEQAAEPQ